MALQKLTLAVNPTKTIFILFLFVSLIQVLIASHPIIKPISWMKDLTIFYGIIIFELVTFPLVLAIIFAYLLNNIKWLSKKTFLITFVIISLLLAGIILFGEIAQKANYPDYYYAFSNLLQMPLVFVGMIGLPLIYLLGWSGWIVLFFSMIIGIYITAFIFALISSFIARLAVKFRI